MHVNIHGFIIVKLDSHKADCLPCLQSQSRINRPVQQILDS